MCVLPTYMVQLNSNLTLLCMSLVGARKFSKTTRELDATTQMCLEELMTCDAREGLCCMPNHLSRVLEQVIAHDNHETLDQTRIWYAALLKAPSSNEIQLNTHRQCIEGPNLASPVKFQEHVRINKLLLFWVSI